MSDIGFRSHARKGLPDDFFERDPRIVARDLLGCTVASRAEGHSTAGVIVEAEAYLGADDPGSHASTKGITKRNAVMYGPPGDVYVYFTYGNHFMLNLVCCPVGQAGAVLIRALKPVAGLDVMTARRGGRPLGELCNGPGKLAQALGVDLSDNGTHLGTGRLHVYAGMQSRLGEVATSGRVGLTSGHDLPYRFYVEGSAFVSRGRTGPMPVRRRARSTGGGEAT